jgi:hypothetical protein
MFIAVNVVWLVRWTDTFNITIEQGQGASHVRFGRMLWRQG